MTVTVSNRQRRHGLTTANLTGAPVLLPGYFHARFVPDRVKVLDRHGRPAQVMVSGLRPDSRKGKGWRSKTYRYALGRWWPRMPDWLVRVVAEVGY